MPNFFPSFSSLFRLRLPVASCPCFVQFPPSSATVPPFPFYCVRHLWLRYVPHPDRYLLCCMLPNRSLERCILLLSNPYRVFCWSVSYSYFYSCVCSKHLSPPPQTVRIVPTVMGHCHVLRLHSPPPPPTPHVAGKDSPVEKAATGRSANRHCVRKHRSQQQCQRQHAHAVPLSLDR